MNPQSATKVRAPSPIFGILAPGEKRTRKFKLLPVGVMPLLQNFPNGSVSLVEMGRDFVTVENLGDARSPFSVLFVTQDQVKKLMLVKQAVDMLAASRKKSQ